MKTSLVIALAVALGSASACLAADCSKQSDCKKVSILQKLFHKKADTTASSKTTHGDTEMNVAGTNFIIN